MKRIMSPSNLYLAMLLLIISFVACKKENIPTDNLKKGVIYWTGAPEVDGCGWLVMIEGESYHPLNLSPQFQKDGLNILLEFEEKSTVYRCGLAGTPYNKIEISQILERNWQVEKLSEEDGDKLSFDMFFLDTVFVDGDSLRIHVSHSGGCGIHQYNLWELAGSQDEVPHLLFEHEDNGDLCEAIVYEELAFSLIPLRSKNGNSISFIMRGSPIMSSFYGEFTYEW